jgi:hypothetical protein
MSSHKILEILTTEDMFMDLLKTMLDHFQRFAELLLHKVDYQKAAIQNPSITIKHIGISEAKSEFIFI